MWEETGLGGLAEWGVGAMTGPEKIELSAFKREMRAAIKELTTAARDLAEEVHMHVLETKLTFQRFEERCEDRHGNDQADHEELVEQRGVRKYKAYIMGVGIALLGIVVGVIIRFI